jgi:multiple sugar transport system ATP-binding protein
MRMNLRAVRVEKIRKHYAGNPVLDDFSLAVEPGEFLVLLGPSGCGKSTLLNIIAGVEPHEDGRVFIGDQDVTQLEPGARNVAMVFQSFALYPTMSARDNIAFSLRQRRMPAAEVRRRVEDVAAKLRISNLLDRRPAQLSGGQQQRVAIGRALVRDPSALLLDEPLSSLDAKLRAELRFELKKLHDSTPRTTLYVTHDQHEALTLASRIVVMDQGRILQCDTPANIYERPANRTVASFVGTPTMKFVEGQIDLTGPVVTLRTDGGTHLPLPRLAPVAMLADGQAVVLGMRSEHVRIVPAGTQAIMTGRVLVRELAGADTYLLADVGGHEITVRTASNEPVECDDRLPLRIDGAAVSLFCPREGTRLN